MSNVLITGTTKGIGQCTANLFLSKGYNVFGIDIVPSTIDHPNYKHYCADVSKESELPTLPIVPDIIINNAGIQTGTVRDIEVNLVGSILVTKKYACDRASSILFNASASAITGAEFDYYSASKGGLVTYMKNVAIEYAKYGTTVNAISCGGVLTALNKPVMESQELWSKIMDITPLKKWAEPEEIADLIFYLTVTNKSITAQNILVDNGERDARDTFIWPD